MIDGKRLHGVSDSDHITHIVELFASEKRLVIAQEKVPDQANEQRALPAFLDSIDVKSELCRWMRCMLIKQISRKYYAEEQITS